MWRRLFRCLFPCGLACCLWPFCMQRKRSDDGDDEALCDYDEIYWRAEAPLTDFANREKSGDMNIEYAKSLNIKDNTAHFEEKLVSLLEKLMAEGWKSRLLARSIIPMSYSGVSSATKGYLLQSYCKLCMDPDVCVRQVSIGKLPELAKYIEKDFYSSHILPVFQALEKETQEVVRLEAAEALISIISFHNLSEEIYKNLFSLMHHCLHDKSWRVRYVISRDIIKVHESLGSCEASRDILPLYQGLLDDPELVVRMTASSHWGEFCRLLKKKRN